LPAVSPAIVAGNVIHASWSCLDLCRAAVRPGENCNLEMAPLKWGLIPPWAKDPKIGNKLVNARADTIAEKPSFRSAFKKRRCLVPADGYYE
jgi:putative SOS response-associated peptidase YedK